MAFAITHPEKVLFPDCGVTKGELCEYYEQLSSVMLPHLRGRPITLERFPAGIGQKGFVQKDVSKGFPEWLPRVEVKGRARRSDGTDNAVHYALAAETRDLLWMANQNAITLHVWASRLPDLDAPDCCVFDLDPTREDPPQLARATLLVRDLLAELGLSTFVKTSGSKGFHIIAGLDGSTSFDSTWRFGLGVGAELVRRHPDIFTQDALHLVGGRERRGHSANLHVAQHARAARAGGRPLEQAAEHCPIARSPASGARSAAVGSRLERGPRRHHTAPGIAKAHPKSLIAARRDWSHASLMNANSGRVAPS